MRKKICTLNRHIYEKAIDLVVQVLSGLGGFLTLL